MGSFAGAHVSQSVCCPLIPVCWDPLPPSLPRLVRLARVASAGMPLPHGGQYAAGGAFDIVHMHGRKSRLT